MGNFLLTSHIRKLTDSIFNMIENNNFQTFTGGKKIARFLPFSVVLMFLILQIRIDSTLLYLRTITNDVISKLLLSKLSNFSCIIRKSQVANRE